MLTNEEILQAVDAASLANGPGSFVLAVGRAIEAKVLAKLHVPYAQGKTCRTGMHLDTDPRQAPCVTCRDFAGWKGADGAQTSQAPSNDRATCPAHGGDYHWSQDCPGCVKDARERGMSLDTYQSRVRPYLRPRGMPEVRPQQDTELPGMWERAELVGEAFHRAITDGAIGQDEVEDIKRGLRAVFDACGVGGSDER